jgi:Recombinase
LMRVATPRVSWDVATERVFRPTVSSLPLVLKKSNNIYSMFVEDGKSEREIALELNRQGILSNLGRPWTRASIHQILTNEKYIGNNVFNRVSYKLKQRRVVNQRDTWVRADGVFPSIVDRALFERARAIIDQRGNHYSDEELLTLLQTVLAEEGALSGLIIDGRDGMPSSSLYRTASAAS